MDHQQCSVLRPMPDRMAEPQENRDTEFSDVVGTESEHSGSMVLTADSQEPVTPDKRPERLVGRLWTHDEITKHFAKIPTTTSVDKSKTPAHWPTAVKIDPGKWVHWLPDNWGQGIKTTASGKELKCFVTPHGKLFYHKMDIEKFLGQPLPKENPEAARPKSQTVEEALDSQVPRWPEQLPRDWRVAWRRLAGGTVHKIFIPPQQLDKEIFMWNLKDVESFLAGNTNKGTPLNGYQRSLKVREACRQAKKRNVETAENGEQTPPTSSKRSRRISYSGNQVATQPAANDKPLTTLEKLWQKGPPSGPVLGQAVTLAGWKSRGCNEVELSAPIAVEDSDEDCSCLCETTTPHQNVTACEQFTNAAAPPQRLAQQAEGRSRFFETTAQKNGVTESEQFTDAAAPPQQQPQQIDDREDGNDNPMPPATLEEFLHFLQCQICLEAREITKTHVDLKDEGARAMWPAYEAFVTPNLGSAEKWVPYHTVLGVHEFFLVESVHHRNEPRWNAQRRFLAIFIFRAHCKKDLFTQCQLPFLQQEWFWNDPLAAFAEEGPLERAMRHYRKTTRQPLLTLAMRMIPDRLLEDDDDNLVRSIILRTQKLLRVAENAWPVINDLGKTAEAKFADISSFVQQANGLGETWAKMMTVCIDLAYPEIGLLASQCEVGIGAIGPLFCLLGDKGAAVPKEALQELLHILNNTETSSSQHFWNLLWEVEGFVRNRHNSLPLILKQVRTRQGGMTASTLQVQLCEYRQFRNHLARTQYGLQCDESMKLVEKEKRSRAEDSLEYDDANKRIIVHMPEKAEKQSGADARQRLEVSLTAAGGRHRLAERVALLCFERLRDGDSMEEVLRFRDMLYGECEGIANDDDAPEDNEAWKSCRANLKHKNPLVGFAYQVESGPKIPFQTTIKAAGSVMNAERIARLCWVKLEQGLCKDAVVAYRNDLYKGMHE
mmetsp:Transcript_70936/g.140774  ORF Transcript_70936/g.140774 Transcript_70936/m.140774 type:complete len:944 (-) Transcript_70936:28-2859(-)